MFIFSYCWMFMWESFFIHYARYLVDFIILKTQRRLHFREILFCYFSDNFNSFIVFQQILVSRGSFIYCDCSLFKGCTIIILNSVMIVFFKMTTKLWVSSKVNFHVFYFARSFLHYWFSYTLVIFDFQFIFKAEGLSSWYGFFSFCINSVL